MELRREPVLFGISFLLVGFLGWQLYDEHNNPLRKPSWSKKGLDVPPARVPDLAKLPIPVKPSDSEARRNLFAEPRDTRPLPKLKLVSEVAVPDPDPYSILMPPPVPGIGPKLWSQYLRVPGAIEPNDLGMAAAANGEAAAPGESPGGVDAGTDVNPPSVSPSSVNPPASGAVNTATPQAEVKLTDEMLEKRYDRVVLRAGGRSVWGRILNSNKYDLKEYDPIRFQIYDEKKDKAFSLPQEYQRADLLTVQLAKTTKNQLEQNKRKIAWIAGNERSIREHVLWCLDRGHECPDAFVEAETQAKKAIELGKNDPVNYVLLGKVYEATFRYEDAWKLYLDMTTGAFKSSADAWVSRAQLEMRLHLDKDARESFGRGAQLDPTGWRPKFVAGDFWLAMGLAAEALPFLESARKNEPGEVEYALIRARIRRRLGEAALALGKLDEAADAFEKARKANENDRAAATGLAVVHWLRKEPKPALDLLNVAIAAEPTMRALVTRGLVKLTTKDFLGAKRDFESAIGLDPVRDVRPLSCLAFLYWITGHTEDAVSSLDRALANEPNDPYSLYLRGRMRRERTARDGAREDFKAAAISDLGFVDPIAELGILASDEELVDLADRYYSRVLEFDPKNPTIHVLRGRNLLLGSQIRRARDAFLAATALDKTHPLAKIGIALCNYYEDNPMGMKVELAAVRDGRVKGDRFQKYAEDLLKLVEIHEQKEEWNDTFDRPSIARLPWNTVRVQGLTALPVAGEVHVEGLFETSGVARIWQEIPARLFRGFEVDLKIPLTTDKPDANQTDVTVFVQQEERRQSQGKTVLTFEASITRERKKADGTAPIVFRYREADEAPPPKEITFAWPADRAIRVRFERNDDDNNPRGRIWLDNELVVPDVKFPRGSPKDILVGISAAAETGRSCSFSFDNVRILRMRADK